MNCQPLEFSYNWNNKLDCRAFTTIRRHNPEKYYQGRRFEIRCGLETKGIAEIIEVRTFRLSQFNEYMARLDTGYSLIEAKQIIRKMYPDATEKTLFDFILFQKEATK